MWIITLAGGFGQPPLPSPMTVTSEGGVIASEFSRVLESIPVEHIWEEVGKAIKQDLKVLLSHPSLASPYFHPKLISSIYNVLGYARV